MKTIDLVYLGEGVKGVKGCFGFFFWNQLTVPLRSNTPELAINYCILLRKLNFEKKKKSKT